MRVRSFRLLLTLGVLALLALGGASQIVVAGGAPVMGDVDCDGGISTRDNQALLREVLQQNALSQTQPCTPIGDAFDIEGTGERPWGDMDCDNGISTRDNQGLLRKVLQQNALSQTEPCPDIGAEITPGGGELPPTSEELIAAALERGDIQYEESLRYRALALYDLPGLPEAYRSPVIDWHAGGELSTEIEENRATLSQGLLDEIAPILARPNDPISIFNNPPEREGQAVPAAVPAGWRRSPAAGGAVYAWIREGPGADAQLATNVAAIGRVWNALPGIFRYGLPDTPNMPSAAVNPDSAIDIYFVDPGGVDPRWPGCDAVPTPADCTFSGNGVTTNVPPNAGHSWSSYIQINTRRQGDALLDTLAHELGHSGQYAYDTYEPAWLKDATAAWTAVRVVQKLGATQTRAYESVPDFYEGLHETMTRDVGQNRYGSWLFFFFASMERGDSVVTSIWQEAARAGKQNEDAVDLIFPFEEKFDDFTVRNWNRDPVDPLYSDGDFNTAPRGEPTFPNLKPDLDVDMDFQGNGTQDINENPLPLSALYYRYTFGPGVKKVTFTNSVVGNPDAHIWAIYKIGSDWEEPEDWSEDEKHVFCRDSEDQEITEIIIVLSNSDKRNSLAGGSKLLMEAETDECQASVTATYHFDDGYHEDWLVTADVQWVEDPDHFFGCNCRVFFAEGTIDWHWELGWESDYSDPPCHEVDSGSIDADGQMMILWEDPTYPDDYVLTAGAGLPASWYSECEMGGRGPLELWYLQPDWEPPVIIPTIPPLSQGEIGPAAAPPPDCRGPIFLVPRNATRFSGSCMDHQDAVSSLRYDWIIEIGQP